MNTRTAAAGLAVILVLGGLGYVGWTGWRPAASDDAASVEADDAPLPLPPVPPRIAQGDDYERCLALLISDPQGAQSLAETWATAGGGEGAEHCLALARVALGDPEEGAGLLERLADSRHGTPAARSAIYRQAAQAWRMAGDAQRAFAAAGKALAITPDDPDALMERGLAGGALERWQSVVDDLSRALDVDRSRVDALVLRGSAWRHLGRDAEAADDVDRALALDAENAEALLERGILRQRRADAAGARADWQKAISLAPESAAADLAEQNLALLEVGPERN